MLSFITAPPPTFSNAFLSCRHLFVFPATRNSPTCVNPYVIRYCVQFSTILGTWRACGSTSSMLASREHENEADAGRCFLRKRPVTCWGSTGSAVSKLLEEGRMEQVGGADPTRGEGEEGFEVEVGYRFCVDGYSHLRSSGIVWLIISGSDLVGLALDLKIRDEGFLSPAWLNLLVQHADRGVVEGPAPALLIQPLLVHHAHRQRHSKHTLLLGTRCPWCSSLHVGHSRCPVTFH